MRTLCLTLLLVVLVPAAAGAQADPYREGQAALDRQDWPAAAQEFARAAAAGGERVDAALYWRAYALQRAGRGAEAVPVIADLRRRFPRSEWLDDARALELEIRPPANGAAGEIEDQELRLYAVSALMQAQPERAVPILEQLLARDEPRELKERALFVLSQSSSPRARELLMEMARGRRQPELQRKAIEYLGLFGGEDSARLLAAIYAESADAEVKEQVLQSYMIGGRKPEVLAAARDERDPRLRRKAIQLLGVMGARAELHDMFAGGDSAVRRDVLQALFVAGDVDFLAQVARAEGDPAVRRQAIEGLGVSGRDRAGPILMELYRQNTDHEVKSAVLNGLFVQGNAAGLIELARQERDRGLRREALQRLSLMNSPEALDFLLKALEER